MKTRTCSSLPRSLLFVLLTLLALLPARPTPAQVLGGITTVTIAASDPSASEAGPDPGVFVVKRTGPTNVALLVFYHLGGTASNGVDYELLPNSVQIPAGAFEAPIKVVPIEDNLVEGHESVLAQITGSPLACATCGYNIGVPSNAVVVIADNDFGTVTNRSPEILLNSPLDGQVLAAPADIVLRAYAQDPEDGFNLKVEFFEDGHSLGFGTFVPTLCPSPYCPFFALVWSNVPPGAYTLTAAATDSQGASSTSAPVHVVVIETNVVAQPIVNLEVTDDTAREIPLVPPWLEIAQEFDPAVFTVSRTGPTDLPLTVFYRVGGTALNGVDYEFLPGEITIPAGASSAVIEVDVIDDFLVEGTETVELKLQPPVCVGLFPPPPGCYLIGDPSSGVVSILDNDLPGTNLPPEVRMVTPPDGSTFVGPTNILLGADAIDRDGSVAQVEFFEGHHSLGLATGPLRTPLGMWLLTWSNVVPGRYTIVAQATDNLGAATISAPVSVTVVSNAPPPPPTNRPPIVSIVARDPFASEGTNFWGLGWETNRWWIDLWNPWHVNLGGSNTATFVVHRHGSTNEDLAVQYAIGGTASNGVDYVLLPGSVTIPSGRRSAQIVVMPLEDNLVEGIETVVLKLEPTLDYLVGFPARAAAIIVDNDLPRPPCLMLPDREFHLCQPATNGFCFRVEASIDLLQWSALCTNVVTDGALHFIDPDGPTLGARFYRAMPEPGLPPDE